jgi:DNA repair exonuclease SbcCD ATPase subunit
MLKIYDINEEIQALDGLLDSWASNHEGDITDFPLNDEFDRLEGKRNEKLLNMAVWHKDLKGQAEAFDKEIKRLQGRFKALNNKAERIKEYIDYNLQEGEKLSDTRAVLSYRKSTQVVIDVLVEDLPPEFVKFTRSADKTAMKEAIQSKEGCHCAHIETKFNLQIK